jgi:hypothetical protein
LGPFIEWRKFIERTATQLSIQLLLALMLHSSAGGHSFPHRA